MQRQRSQSTRLADRRGLNGAKHALRQQLLAFAEATVAKLEAAEETGRPVIFPDRVALAERGGLIGEVLSGLHPDDVDRVPDEYLPYLLDTRFHRTRLHPVEVKEIFEGQGESASPAPDPPRKKVGGRPPKEFWEDLLIEITRQIHYAELKTTKVDDIVSRMDEWLIAHGHHNVSDSTLKKPARKILEAFLAD